MCSIQKLTEEDIQEVFYNILCDIILTENDNPDIKIDLNNSECIKYLLKKVLHVVFIQINNLVTSKGIKITVDNVPGAYKDFFRSLEMLPIHIKNNHDCEHIPEPEPYIGYVPKKIEEYYDKLIKKIQQRQTFVPMINKTKIFINECTIKSEILPQSHSDLVEIISSDAIRESFYNIMVDVTITSGKISKDDLIDQESYIFIGLPAYTLLYIAIDSQYYDGIKLLNGQILVPNNCPEEFKSLFGIMIKIKSIIKNISLSQITYIQNKLLHKSDLQDLQYLQTVNDISAYQIEIANQIVSMITDISIEISRIDNFKHIINDVIRFCIDAM